MARAATLFFVFALVSMALGVSGATGLSLEGGELLLVVFVFLSGISYIASLFVGVKSENRFKYN